MSRYSYKEFSNISHTSIRTLRWYEKLGLLQPNITNGIKTLEDEDFLTLQTINLLKNASYTLREIKNILDTKNIAEQIIIQKDILNLQSLRIKSMLDLISTIEEQGNVSKEVLIKHFQTVHHKLNITSQFATTNNLETRIAFHHKYTKYKDTFQKWMFQKYSFGKRKQVLEVGCGDGTIWKENESKIPLDITITMTDISSKMVEKSKEVLSHLPMFKEFREVDAHYLPYPNASFDIVIINHVLMYLDDVDLALREIHRVLKPSGKIYCSYIGEDMMKERDALITKFNPKVSFGQDKLLDCFGIRNGQKKLTVFFKNIECYNRKETYQVTSIDDYYEFIISGKGIGEHMEDLYKNKESFYQYIKKEHSKKGYLPLTVDAGMFIAERTDYEGDRK